MRQRSQSQKINTINTDLKWNWNLTARWILHQRCTLKKTKRLAVSSRRAVDVSRSPVVLFDLVVDVEAALDFVLEVAVHLAGVVLDLDLAHARDPQQHVLVVDEGPLSTGQWLVVVPLGPVEAVQQGALSILSRKQKQGVFGKGNVYVWNFQNCWLNGCQCIWKMEGTHGPKVGHTVNRLKGNAAIAACAHKQVRHGFGVIVGAWAGHSICHWKTAYSHCYAQSRRRIRLCSGSSLNVASFNRAKIRLSQEHALTHASPHSTPVMLLCHSSQMGWD